MRSEKTNSNKCLDCPAGSQILQKALHRFGRGGPAGDQADTGVLGIHRVVHFKFIAQVLQRLQELVKEHGVSDKVDLNGAFCTGNCVNGVCVTVDGELFSLKPETTDDFFAKEILGRL